MQQGRSRKGAVARDGHDCGKIVTRRRAITRDRPAASGLAAIAYLEKRGPEQRHCSGPLFIFLYRQYRGQCRAVGIFAADVPQGQSRASFRRSINFFLPSFSSLTMGLPPPFMARSKSLRRSRCSLVRLLGTSTITLTYWSPRPRELRC